MLACELSSSANRIFVLISIKVWASHPWHSVNMWYFIRAFWSCDVPDSHSLWHVLGVSSLLISVRDDFFISGDHRSGHKQNSANTQDTNCGRLCEGHVQYLVILHTLLGNIYNINQSRNRAAPRGQLFQKVPRQKTSHITIQTAENHFLCT